VPAAVAAALAIGLLVAAAITWSASRTPAPDRTSSMTASATAAAGPVASAPQDRRHAPHASPGAGAPDRVVITSLGVDAPVVPVVAAGSTLDPPSDPRSLGWWSQGARPGAARGSALVTGHTVHDGGGALDDLERLDVGQEVVVRTNHGRVDYVVASVVVLDKAAIARRAPRLFSQEVPGRLVLVTCEGWDGTGYTSNVVVTATPVD
jgi:hypothetical protein